MHKQRGPCSDTTHAQPPQLHRRRRAGRRRVAAPRAARAGQAREDQGRRSPSAARPRSTTCRSPSPSSWATSRPKASTSRSPTSPAARARCRRWWAARPTWCSRRLRAHHQPAGQEPVLPVVRAAGPRAADRDGRVDQDHARLQGARRPQGQEDRRVGAGLVDQHGGQPGALARGLQGQRRQLRRRGRRGRRADGAALGPDRRDEQHRPGDDDARAEGRREDHQRHAHAQGHAGGVRRPDAGGLPLRAAPSSSRRTPTPARRWPTPSCTASSGCRRPGPSDIIKTVPESLPAGRPRAVPRLVQQGARGDRARRHGAGRGRADRAEGARQLRPQRSRPTRSTWPSTYTNEFARRAKDRFKA